MWYAGANRDPLVFDDPHRFDIERTPNPQLSFGIGEHFCLGANLARLSLRLLFETLLTTVHDIELVAPPRRLHSNLIKVQRRETGDQHARCSSAGLLGVRSCLSLGDAHEVAESQVHVREVQTPRWVRQRLDRRLGNRPLVGRDIQPLRPLLVAARS
jgi:hypothetical protein